MSTRKKTGEYILNSAGQVEHYPDPYKGVTQSDVALAQILEAHIQHSREVIEEWYRTIGKHLAEFAEKKLWKARGYTSLKQWSEAPEINLGYAKVSTLIRFVRDALPVIEKNVDAMEIPVTLNDMKILLPILKDEDGERKFIDALFAIQGLTAKDAREVVKEIRGLKTDQPLTPIFAAKVVERGDDGYLISIIRTDSQEAYECTVNGPIFINKEDWPVWESRFGRFIQHEVT